MGLFPHLPRGLPTWVKLSTNIAFQTTLAQHPPPEEETSVSNIYIKQSCTLGLFFDLCPQRG